MSDRADLLDQITELKAEVSFLRAELGRRDDHAARFAASFGLTPAAGIVLSTLYAANGRWVLRDVIHDRLPSIKPGGRRRGDVVSWYLWAIRKAKGADSVLSTGFGSSFALKASQPLLIELSAILAQDAA